MNTPERLTGPAGLVLDLKRRAADVNGVAVDLGRHEFDLLAALVDGRGRVLSFDELSLRAWGHLPAGDQRFIYTATWRLRRALAAAGAPQVIQSVRGVGYTIAGDGASTTAPFHAIAVFDPEDPTWRLSMVNDGAVALTGHSVEVLTSEAGAAMKLWPPEERSLLDEIAERAMNSGSASVEGQRLIRADGTTVLVDITLSRLDLPGAAPLGLAILSPSPQ